MTETLKERDIKLNHHWLEAGGFCRRLKDLLWVVCFEFRIFFRYILGCYVLNDHFICDIAKTDNKKAASL